MLRDSLKHCRGSDHHPFALVISHLPLVSFPSPRHTFDQCQLIEYHLIIPWFLFSVSLVITVMEFRGVLFSCFAFSLFSLWDLCIKVSSDLVSGFCLFPVIRVRYQGAFMMFWYLIRILFSVFWLVYFYVGFKYCCL